MRLSWLILLTLLSVTSQAETRIHSAVSANFMHGLQVEYIKYLCAKMGAEADIVPMTYARRLIEIDSGSLDLMVGVSNVAPIGNQTVLLRPAYESLSLAIYVLAGNESFLTQESDLSHRIISMTRKTNSKAIFDAIPPEHIVSARSVEQKIQMLLMGRIEAFLHIQQGADLKLTELQLKDKVVLSTYQPPKEYEQHVAINIDSWLFAHKQQLESLIRSGVANGDFLRIRRQYYARTPQ